jgi:hypothetical protein
MLEAGVQSVLLATTAGCIQPEASLHSPYARLAWSSL